MPTNHVAAGELTSAIGVLPATGVALILAVIAVLGVVGKGKKKLNSGPAQLVGLLAELTFLRCPSPFGDIGDAFQSVSLGIADAEQLGAPGITTVCLLWLALAAFARVVPGAGVVLGMLLGGAMETADGSIWKAAEALISLPVDMLAG